jgi:phosphocarrier protein
MELEQEVEISNKYGLHARASTRLAQVAKQFDSAIRVSRPGGDEEVDAKSILGILTLGVEKGQTLRIWASGADAEDAMAAVVQLVRNNFDEE